MSNSGTSSQTQTLPACLRSTSTSCRRTGSPSALATSAMRIAWSRSTSGYTTGSQHGWPAGRLVLGASSRSTAIYSFLPIEITTVNGVRCRAMPRRLLAEFLGSAFLAALVIGSGIAAQQLSEDAGLQLLENAAATAAGLFAIILMFGPVSGGHFNPVVSLVDAAFGGLSRRDALAYVPAQIAGCVTGAVVANAMFALAAISISTHHRASPAHLFAEAVATLGLILVIFALARSGRAATAPAAVGAYIGAAYWFTSSTSFANPAITVGRTFSDTFAGIAPASVPSYVLAQFAGGALAV